MAATLYTVTHFQISRGRKQMICDEPRKEKSHLVVILQPCCIYLFNKNLNVDFKDIFLKMWRSQSSHSMGVTQTNMAATRAHQKCLKHVNKIIRHEK